MIHIDGYLIEEKLVNILKEICQDTENAFIGTQIRINPIKTMPFDIELFWQGNKIMVEFDGYRHYSESIVMYHDYKKETILKELGYSIIRIPYWVQLDSETFKYYFNMDYPIKTNFPHGFIDKKALLPASFCNLGFIRFEKELGNLPENIRSKIIDSLYKQSKIRNIPIKYIYK